MATGVVGGANMERIWVMHMIDPETFWFVGADDEAFRKQSDEHLTEFMKNQITTSDTDHLYTPVVGQLVAVLNPGTSLWQRAEVQEVTGPDGNQCYIFLVDHGIAVTVPTSMIRPIPKNANLCDRGTFLSSRLRLRGLSPITTEISSDGHFKHKLTATSEWDTSAFTFVSNLFRLADSCYMSNDVESYSYVDGMIFGEVYLGIKGGLVSVIDELVGKHYAGRKSEPQQDALNYKNDPNCLSLGPNLRDKRQASNPMGIQVSKYSLQQAKEIEDFDEEIGGLAIKRKDRSYLLDPTIVKSPADLAEKKMAASVDNIQYFPAGLNVNSLPRTIPSKSASVAKLCSVTTNSCELPNEPKHSLADVPKSFTQSQSVPTVVEPNTVDVEVNSPVKEAILAARKRRLKELLKINDVVPEVNRSKPVAAAASPEVIPNKSVAAAASPEVNPNKVLAAAVSPEVNPRIARLSQRLLKSMIKSGTVKPDVPNQGVEQNLKQTESVVVETVSSDTVAETATTEVSRTARRRSDKVLELIRARAQKMDVSASTSQETAAPSRAVGKTESPALEVRVGAGDVLGTPESSSNTASPTTSSRSFKFRNVPASDTLSNEVDSVSNSTEANETPLHQANNTSSASSLGSDRTNDVPRNVHLEPRKSSEVQTKNEILVHGKHVDQIQEIVEAKFPTEIHKALQKENLVVVKALQKFVWPAILNGDSVFMVGPPKSGKTYGYIVPLLSSILNRAKYSKLPVGNGALAVILCSGSRSCETVAEICTKLLSCSRDETRIIATHGGGAEQEKKIDLINGCEILISTPRCFLRLLESSKALVNLARLCHLVLAESETLVEKFLPEVQAALTSSKQATRRRAARGVDVGPLQLIVASEKWSLPLYSLVHDVAPDPTVCIASYIEAAIYARVRPKLDIINVNIKAEKVLALLEEKKGLFRTVIVLLSVVDVEALVEYLEKNGHKILSAHEKMNRGKLDDVRLQWKSSQVSGNYPVMVCTDCILLDLKIVDAMCIIHWDMPPTKTAFGTRFSCLMGNYPNIHDKIDSNRLECIIHILMHEKNVTQLSGIVQFMKRLGAEILPLLQDVATKLARSKEIEKSHLPLCFNLKAFGSCWSQSSTCPNRHIIIDSDRPNNIPIRGRVKIKIICVLNTCHFSARILEASTDDGQMHAVTDDYLFVAMELALHFSRVSNRLMHGVPIVGDVCALETRINLFQRAEVVAVTARAMGQPTHVRVKLVDKGNAMEVKIQNLLRLPTHLQELPPQVVDVFLCRVAPIDLDQSWSTVSYNQMIKRIECADEEETNGTYFVGDIQLSLANTLWLDPLHIKRSLRTIDADVVKVALRRKLLDDKMAVDNPKHLDNLYALCRSVDMLHVPDNTLPKVDEQPDVKPADEGVASDVRWAFLPPESSYGVVFLSADDAGRVFVRQFEFESSLFQLSRAIQRHVNEDRGIGQAMIIKEGVYCLGFYEEDGLWHRARVVRIVDDGRVEVFFVDYGDRAFVSAATGIRGIDKLHVSMLPFQAIECFLIGLKHEEGQDWTNQVTDTLYDMTVDDTDKAKTLEYKVCKTNQTADCTGGRKYGLVLIDPSATGDSVINRVLVASGLALSNEDEVSFLENLPRVVVRPQFEDDSEEEPEAFESSVSQNQVALPTSRSTDVDQPEIIRLTDLKGVKAQSTNETEDTVLAEDETCFDFEIDDVRQFLFDMIQGRHKDAPLQLMALDALPPPRQLPALCDGADKRRSLDGPNKSVTVVDYPAAKIIVEPGTCSGIRPNVVWYQDMRYVHLSIEIIDVGEYYLDTKPMRLGFSADVGGEAYELDLSFFGAVNPEFTEDFKTGRRVCVKMEKIYQGKWPHLLKNPDKHYFWLKYNIDHAEDADEKRQKSLVEEDEELDVIEYVTNTVSASAVYKPIAEKDGIVADFQYNDSDTDESVNEDYVEDDKPYEFHDFYDPLN